MGDESEIKVSRRRKPRTSTAIRFTADLHKLLCDAAAERDVSINWLVNRAVAYYLDRLIPADEVKWTIDRPAPIDRAIVDQIIQEHVVHIGGDAGRKQWGHR